MQFLGAIILTAAGLAAAAPPGEGALFKRIDKASNCGLDEYQSVTEGPVRDGISFLRGTMVQSPLWVNAGDCSLVSCSHGTGIQICLDKDADIKRTPFDPKEIGDKVEAVYTDCFGSAPSGGDDIVRAFQQWNDGYNILVRGAFDC